MAEIKEILHKIKIGDTKAIAKTLSIVENNLPQSHDILIRLDTNIDTKVVGITGPPGAGKSTIINALLSLLVKNNCHVAVLSIDPSSPFNFGALLGDRIRMSEFYLHKNVFIRSVASRGSLGGLSAHIIEMIDVLRASVFDYILVETVGVGQSEVEIAGIADTTIVALVPEAGDEIQTMKAGVMEIADIFVVNKGDRNNADEFVKNLKILSHSKSTVWEIPVVKTIAPENIGIDLLLKAINMHSVFIEKNLNKKLEMYTMKAFQLIQNDRMKDIDKHKLQQNIKEMLLTKQFNLYQFVAQFNEK